ncbi:MAG: 5'/3'-nucleotidase SurE [Cryobacterium sp.]|nr:5'/3'-nucleotidase SurE [Oligoflexia bacterium]
MRILLCNDDGVHARGIQVLYDFLSKIGHVTVVAPLEEMSTTGHSLTISKPLRVVPIKKDFYGVSGGPADCVQVAIHELFKKKKPDLVVSGTNRGANLGQDVYYSGTVSAAREACVMGLPALAVSLAIDFYEPRPELKLHYETAGALAVEVIRHFSHKGKPAFGFPPGTFLNLNSPDLPLKRVKGISLARQGFRYYSGEILKRRDHRGKDYFWVGGGYKGFLKEEGTDCDIVDKGYASLTPLRLDTTYHEFMLEMMEDWGTPLLPRKKRG